MKSLLATASLAVVTSQFFSGASAQTSFEQGVIDEPSWDKTDHKNNEYLWTLKFN